MTVNPLAKTAEPTGFRKFIRADKTQRVLLIVSFMFVPLVLLLMFTYIPFGKMVQFSFYNRNYLSEGTWVGLANYIEVFKRKDIFGSLIVSVYYMGGAVVQLVLALFFASLMVFKVKGEGIYKACMFFPYLICGIAVGFIFKFFYARGFVLDSILQFFGMDLENIPYWLQDQRINNIALAATSVWRYMGQNMVMFLGAMMSVDSDLYEAAELDGANRWQQFWHITLPQLRPTTFFVVIMLTISGFKVYDQMYMITQGGPGNATMTLVYYIYNVAFVNTPKYGYASAIAMVLFVLVLIVTIVQFRGSRGEN